MSLVHFQSWVSLLALVMLNMFCTTCYAKSGLGNPFIYDPSGNLHLLDGRLPAGQFWTIEYKTWDQPCGGSTIFEVVLRPQSGISNNCRVAETYAGLAAAWSQTNLNGVYTATFGVSGLTTLVSTPPPVSVTTYCVNADKVFVYVHQYSV